MNHHTYTAYQKAILSQQTTVTDTVEYFLKNIELHKDLNVFLEVYAEEALAQSKIIQEKIEKGTGGRLAGMVIGIKEVLE